MYTIIRLEYAYQIATEYSFNNNVQRDKTKSNTCEKRQSSLLHLSPVLREGVKHLK